MARVTISNRLTSDFGMVPNALWRSGLPFAAKGVAAYLCSLRDGAMPYVAEMEQAMGIGRDARRKAFKVLEALGFIQWQIVRDGSRIVAKTLVVDPLVFDRLSNAPESQADCVLTVEKGNAPEIPAGGNFVSTKTEARSSRDCGSGDTLKQNKTKRAAQARAKAKPPEARQTKRSAPVEREGSGDLLSIVAGLNDFHRTCLREGKSFLVDGSTLKPEHAKFQRLRKAAGIR